jgi:hypothetical protein
MRNRLNRSVFFALLGTFTTIVDAKASDSPYQDFEQYLDTMKHCSTLSELKPYTLVRYQNKMQSTDSAESKEALKGTRALFGNYQKLKKRGESKNGNNAIVIADCVAPEPIVMQGKTPQIKPYVLIVTMVKEGALWKVLSTEMKTPQEAADYNVKDAGSMQRSIVWSEEARSVAIPNKPLSGTLQGAPATVSSAMFMTMQPDRSTLDLTMADNAKWKDMHIHVSFNPAEAKAGWITENAGLSQVQVTGTINGKSKTYFFDKINRCGLKLQLLPKKSGSYPAYMVLRLPDGYQSELKGYVYAKAF